MAKKVIKTKAKKISKRPIIRGVKRSKKSTSTGNKRNKSDLVEGSLRFDFRQILNGISDGFFAIDTDLNFLLVNNTFADLAKMSVAEMEGKNMLDLFPFMKGGSLVKVYQQAIKDQQVVLLEHPNSRNPDQVFRIQVTPFGQGLFVYYKDISVLKEVQELLRESEFKSRLILDNVQDGILFCKRDGTVLSANPAACQIFHMTEEEICERGRSKLVDTNDPQFERAINIREREGKYKGEIILKRKDGKPFVADITTSFFYDDKGEEYSTVIFSDITIQKKIERERDALLEKYEKIAEHIPGFIYQYRQRQDGSSHFPYASQGIQDIYGISASEAVEDANKVFSVLHPEDLYQVQLSIQRSAESMSEWRDTYRVNHPSGKTIWVEGFATPQRLEDRSILWHGYITDVTNKRASEIALQQSENRLNTILSNLIHGVVMVSYDGKITYANPPACKILSIKLETLQQRYSFSKEWGSVDEQENPLSPDQLPVARAMREKSAVLNLVHGVRKEDSTIQWLSVNAAPLFDDQKNVIGAVTSFVDITNERADQIALQKANQEIAEIQSNLNAFFESSTDCIILLNQDFQITNFNSLAAKYTIELTGLNLSKGESILNFSAPSTRQSFIDNFHLALQGQIIRKEIEIIYGNKNGIWWRVQYIPLRDSDQSIMGVAFVSTNIDNEIRSSQRLKSLTDNLPDSVIYEYWESADLNNYQFTYLSQGAANFFEIPIEQLLNDSSLLFDMIEPEYVQMMQEAGAKSRREMSNFDVVYKIKLRSGKFKWVRTKAKPKQLIDGSILYEGITIDITSQKLLEQERIEAFEKIEESENNLAAILNASNDSTVFVDLNGKVRVINNEGVRRLRRFYSGDIIGGKFVDFLPPIFKEEFTQLFDRACAGESIMFERESRFEEGHHWLYARVLPVYNKQRQLIGVSQNVTDITERKLAELGLKQSEERFRFLYNRTPAMMDSINEKGELISVNDFWLEKMGYNREEVIGKSASSFLAPDSQELSDRVVLKEFFEKGSISNVEYNYVTKSGKILVGLLSANAERDANGKIIRSLSVINDITEKKKLTREVEKLALIAQKTSNLVIITNPNQEIEWVNRSFEQVTGYTLPEVLGKKPSSFLQGPDTDKAINGMVKENLQKKLPTRFEIINYDKKGQRYWLDIEIQPVFDSQGILCNYIAIESDITLQKLAENALRNSQKRLQAIFDNAINSIILADDGGNYVDGNNAVCKLLGYTHEEFIKLNVKQVAVPSSAVADPFGDFLHDLRQVGAIDLRTKEGKIITVRYNAVANILPGLHLSILEDITDKLKSDRLIKIQAEELQAKNEQFVSITENIPNSAIYQLLIREDRSKQFLFMSSRIKQLTGIPKEDVLENSELFYQNILHKDQFYFNDLKEKAIQNLSMFSCEFRHMHANGSIRWLHIYSMPKVTEVGILFDGYITDITDQKTLTESLYLTRFTVDHALDSIFWIEESGYFFDFNVAAYESLGYTKDEFATLAVSDIDPNYRHEVWPFHWAELKKNRTLTFESTQRRKDGTHKEVEITANLISYYGKDYNCAFVRDITERKLSNQKIREKEELLKTIASNLPNGAVYQFLMTDKGDFSFPFISEGVESFIGINAQQIMSNASMVFPTLHPDDADSFFNAVLDSAKAMSDFHFCGRFKDVANQYHWLTAHSKPRKLTDNSVIWDGILIDDTKQKESEELMKFTTFTLDHISDTILWIKQDGTLINANPAASIELGYSIAELQKMSIADFDLVYTKEIWPSHWLELGQRKSLTFESVYRRKDQSVFPVEINASIIEYDGKEYNCAIVRNISERKKVEMERAERERALAESEERFRHLIRDLQVGVLLQDANSKILMNNEAAIELLGISEDQLLGKTSFDAAWNVIRDNGETFPGEMHPVPMAIRTRKPVEDVIMGVFRPNTNDRIWLQVNAHPIFSQNGELLHVICSFLDISKVREYQENLKRNLIEKELLVKEIHHRVKNNLQLISSLIYIRMTRMEQSEVKKFLEETRQKIHAIALIHETLLQKESVNEINIADIMERLLVNLQSSYSTVDKTIHVKHSIEPIKMKLDTAINCSLILNELFTNSIKHAFNHVAEGTIEVNIQTDGKEVFYQISDNGSGLEQNITLGKEKTFGLLMLDVFFKQINADVTIDRTNGTLYIIRFPLE